MANEKAGSTVTDNAPIFVATGLIQREQSECRQGEMKLQVYVFDKAGVVLGTGDVDAQGNYKVPVRLKAPAAVELVAGPPGDPQEVRRSNAYSRQFSAADWKGDGRRFVLEHNALVPLDLWILWWPLHLCISGHVYKVDHHDEASVPCPVPYVKVEIFDVDREFCWWPWFRKWWEGLLDRRVFRIPDLMKEPPFPPRPFPGPDPVPDLKLEDMNLPIGRNPLLAQPRLATQLSSPMLSSDRSMVSDVSAVNRSQLETSAAFTRVGEARLIDSAVASRLDRLTLTSKIAPWDIFPLCFYSKALICETTTDCSGYFKCCFNWWPFHFRRGRLRFDSRPDIIIKVTQIIDGVETVIYMDPYTSTRWNVTNAHVDLFLDNEEVRCGNACGSFPTGTTTFFTLVGLDEVYKINQATGKFGNVGFGGTLNNWAYGGSLLFCALFGDTLSTGAPKRYYRLSYKPGLGNPDPNDNTGFIPINYPLSDTRVNKITFASENVLLGPQPPINGVPNLYEIRNREDYYWYNPDKIGWWNTELVEEDTGIYTIRLEVFNEAGVKLTSADVDYRNGTVAPPAVLPPMNNRCDLVVLVDNKPPVLGLTVPGASGECGVVPFEAVPGLTINAFINQENDRLYYWRLSYVKGISGGSGVLGSDSDPTGILPLPLNLAIPAAPMTAGLTGTCAFGLTLGAWPLVRNGFGLIHYAEKQIAIAIEKCPVCPTLEVASRK